MVSFREMLQRRNPERFPEAQAQDGTVQTVAVPPESMRGAKQIANMVDDFMPMVEQITGLNRREISLQLLKTGFRGGNLGSFLDALSGNPAAKPSRFEKIVRTGAIWIPVGFGLMGLFFIALWLFFALASKLVNQI